MPNPPTTRRRPPFRDRLAAGKEGEGLIAAHFSACGWGVVSNYSMIDEFKGPRLFVGEGEYALPDLQVFNPAPPVGRDSQYWIEAKLKTSFSWHRRSQRWVTGFDLKYFEDYCEVERLTGIPVAIWFLHSSDKPDPSDIAAGSPPTCPAGVFFAFLTHLAANESHRHGGMVYWAVDALTPCHSLQNRV